MNSTPNREDIKQLQDAIFQHRPILKELITKRGDKSLYEYTKDYISVNLNPPIRQRQEEMISTIEEEAAKLLGADVAAKVAKQLWKYYYVSTADHHGPISHPLYVNSNLLLAAPYAEINDPDLQFVIVLACTSISFRNSSFPRGLLYHNKKNLQSEPDRIAFFPASMRACPVFNWRAYTEADIKAMQADLNKQMQNGKLDKADGQRLVDLITEVYLDPSTLACKTFAEQVTKTNYKLWPKLFKQEPPAQFVTIEQETIVNQLLLKYHMHQDTILNHILFDPAYEPLLKQYFDDLMCAFSIEKKYGSYLFWALPPGAKYREQLWRHGNVLKTDSGSYTLELTPEAVSGAIERREIFPTTLLDSLVLSLYYGLKCVGGFNQINYLTAMKNAYIKMNVDRMNYRSIEVCARAQTKEMSDGFMLAFLGDQAGNTYGATGLDLFLYGDEHTWPKLLETVKSLTVEEGLAPLLPIIYRAVYTEPDRQEALSAITDAQIVDALNLKDKISPSVLV